MRKKLQNQYFILRHGQTTQQIKRAEFTYNWPDKPPVRLTKKGEEQIKIAAKKLKKERINLIYSSDIFRTKQSAGIIARELGLKIHFDKRLRDINLGVYHGGPKEALYKSFPDPRKRFYQRPKKGESWSDCRGRMLSFLRQVDKKYKNKRILIISHGDSLWLLEGAVKGLINKDILDENFVKGNYINVGELRKL
ncbi:histidine phosphatase family protein [Patescibacteria group bacterium]|nr:histidine phosphatase family protein [Patescibacteria group bacterium]